MKAYKTILTVKNPKRLILSNLPFQSGQQVEVVLLQTQPVSSSVKKLFKQTQTLPRIKNITEEDIEKEIAAYRNGL